MKVKSLLKLKEYNIKLEKSGKDSYTVTYGLQKVAKLSRREAMVELGACIFHSLECNGKLD